MTAADDLLGRPTATAPASKTKTTNPVPLKLLRIFKPFDHTEFPSADITCTKLPHTCLRCPKNDPKPGCYAWNAWHDRTRGARDGELLLRLKKVAGRRCCKPPGRLSQTTISRYNAAFSLPVVPFRRLRHAPTARARPAAAHKASDEGSGTTSTPPETVCWSP